MDDLTQQISQRLDLSFGLVRSVIQVKERLNTIESPEGSQEIGIYSGIHGMHPEGLSQTMGDPYHSDSGHDFLIKCYPIFREIHVAHSLWRGCRGEYGVSFLPMQPGGAILYPSHSRSLRTEVRPDSGRGCGFFKGQLPLINWILKLCDSCFS